MVRVLDGQRTRRVEDQVELVLAYQINRLRDLPDACAWTRFLFVRHELIGAKTIALPKRTGNVTNADVEHQRGSGGRSWR